MNAGAAPESGCGASTLGLPLQARGSVWSATAVLFSYYALTMARDLSLYDSGELALAAVQLGLGHPPGQPLHTLLGFALAQLPLLPPVAAVGLASALPGALTLVPASSLAQSLSGPLARPAARGLPWLLALLAVHPILWEPATRVEVYALAMFFALWALARIAAAAPPAPGVAARATLRGVFQAAIALGLCASVNPMIAVCAGLALAPGLLARMARGQLSPLALPLAVLGCALGLLPYAYVPLVAQRDDVMVWGAPRDAQSLWFYLSLRDYAHNQTINFTVWLAHMLGWLRFAIERALLPMIALGVVSSIALGGRNLLGRIAAPALLLLLVAVTSFNVVWNLEVPDYNGYVASGLWASAASAGAFAARAHARGHVRSAYALAVLLALASLVVPPHVLARTRHRDRVARALAEHVLHEAPRDAIVIAYTDYFAGSLFYLQEAERQRPDVVVLAYGLAGSSWHWQRIYQQHRGLHAFALLGRGGRPARVRRFLAANPARALLIERLSIAAELGVRACPGGLYLRAGSACRDPAAQSAEPAALLARALRAVGRGSPSADGAIADAAYVLGEALWRLGQPRAAYFVLLAGVPQSMRAVRLPASAQLERAPKLAGPLPAWQRSAALGDPARNLFVASALAHAAGQHDTARAHLRAAADDGLPEAQQLRRAPQPGRTQVPP